MSWNESLRRILPAPGGIAQIHKSGPGTQALLTCLLLEEKRSVVILLDNPSLSAMYTALLGAVLEKNPQGALSAADRVTVFPAYPVGETPPDLWAERWQALYSLAAMTEPRAIVLPVENLFPKWPHPEILKVFSLEIQKNEQGEPEEYLSTLTDWGYRRVPFVTKKGEMALRGDILDIHPPGYEYPVRIEFFGSEIEEIRQFEAVSQRSKASLRSALILPVTPNPAALAAEAEDKWKILKRSGDLQPRAYAQLKNLAEQDMGKIPPGLFHQRTAGLGQWLPDNAVFVLAEADAMSARLEELEYTWNNQVREQEWPQTQVTQTMGEIRATWTGRTQVVFERLVMGRERSGTDLPEREVREFTDIFWQPEAKSRPWRTLVDALKAWADEAAQTVLCFKSEQSRKKFLHLAAQEELDIQTEYLLSKPGIFAVVSPLARGFELQWNLVRILGEEVLQPRGTQAKISGKKDFRGLDRHRDLVPGELLVHRDYGLGLFQGLVRMQVGQAANDYLLLSYAGEDKLYLPVDRLNVVQKYKGPEGFASSLDRLGGAAWAKSTARAQKAVEKIAHDLVEMYAFRKVAKGFAYTPAGEMYREFEAGFGFEETPDQERAIEDVLRDMETSEPMDRLVCGDVGFGKTEVAMRAAFRAVADGKQVVLLCPTTILAEQHYLNFRQRMDGFSFQAAMLSRFVPQARQKQIVQAAAKGEVDILIGTHRLLSKDIDVPNLSLLILDEEQRFGVKHKERLKKLKKQVDVLTLTATPIPRTLQLSLSGVRGLSVIETPPQDRRPVKTALVERDEKTLTQALELELQRNGQVFWVYNRVENLDEVAQFVSSLAPTARVAMAHGRMPAAVLEETMHRFWHQEIDILVCTAIIESGLDFPKANTLIVDQAQMFGLGQLYQLRGRVGRSDRQAYAYFVISEKKRLSEKAKKRMQVILDMDYLGGGFQVAMEDLRIRGAGNILGESQSGHIGRIGLDMFLEMLETEVRRQRGDPVAQETDPEVNIGFSAHIPEQYIDDAEERLRVYRRLSACRSHRELEALQGEIEDRFGHFPEPFQAFVRLMHIKLRLKVLRVVRADVQPRAILLVWPDNVGFIDPVRVLEWIQRVSPGARLMPPAKLELPMNENISIVSALKELDTQLDDLAKILMKQ